MNHVCHIKRHGGFWTLNLCGDKPMKVVLFVLMFVLSAGRPFSQTSSNNCLPAKGTVCATNLIAGPTNSAIANLSAYVPDDKYKLRIGDRVSFQIIEDRDAPRSLVIADSGELDLPYLGRLAAADKTCKQLAIEIKAALEAEYYYRASVVIALDSANRLLGRVYVWGQVRTQGPIELAVNESLTAGKAVLRAGGFGDFANRKKVKVIRPATASAPKRVFELNMVEILEDGQTEKDLPLQAEDSVIVGSRLINF
jgi:polysaccharide export outer membrane protein